MRLQREPAKEEQRPLEGNGGMQLAEKLPPTGCKAYE